MREVLFLITIIASFASQAQNLTLNEDFIYENLRLEQLRGNLKTNISFNLRPIDFLKNNEVRDFFNNKKYGLDILKNSRSFTFKILPINYNIEYSTHHPYNRNNGSMIPNRGYQHIISGGFFFKAGPLSLQLKPEHHFSENLEFQGFWEDHYSSIWAKRYVLWNHIDMPERFGNIRHNRSLIGQSNVKLNFGKFNIGISNENLWWGPARRNSIMLSNHAQGFKHIFIGTNSPIKTPFGYLESQLITGRLETSKYTPPGTDKWHAGTKLYVRKINQLGETNDWMYFQGFLFSFQPKWINGLSIGLIRWTQMYSALYENKYFWMDGKTSIFPVFNNLFRKNDKFQDYEEQTNQGGGMFFKWFWADSNAEIYAEFHYNDAKQNLRDLLLDFDHSRAVTIGLQKVFKNNLVFSWEWTQLEQSGSRNLRNARSWYEHTWVYHGYTNFGEVLGAGIGPGSNSQYLNLKKINKTNNISIGLEIIDHDNDFYYEAFSSAQDYRRYWKDYNLHLSFEKKFKNFWLSSKTIYSRSLNYQWELDDYSEPYYHSGKDVNNFIIKLKLLYFLDDFLK